MRERLLLDSRLTGRIDGEGNQTFVVNYDNSLSYSWAVNTVTTADGDWIFTASGAQRLVTNPASETTAWKINDRLQMESRTDANGHVTGWGYDELGRQTSETRPLGDQTIWSYAAKAPNQRELARVTGITEIPAPGSKEAELGLERTASISYGAPGGSLTLTRADGSVISVDLDERGNPESVKIGSQQLQTTSFDAYGRLTKSQSPDGGDVKLTWAGSAPGSSAQDLFLSKIEKGDHALTVSTDSRGNVTSISGPSGFDIKVNVNDLDLVERIEKGNDITIQRWDGAENLVGIDTVASGGENPPILESSILSHDAAGRLESMTRNSLVTTWSYDDAGRLQSVVYPGDRSISYGYDVAGQLVAVGDDGAITSYGLDPNGRITTTTGPDGVTVETTLDGFGRETGQVLPNGVRTIETKDSLGRLIDEKEIVPVSESDSWLVYRWTRWEYDEHDRMTVEERLLFDNPLELSDLGAEPVGTSTAIRTEWLWNNETNTLTVIDPRDGRTITQFDDDGTVSRVVDAAGNSVRYEYDEAGRLSSENWTDLSTSGASESGTIRYLYDRQGRLIHEYIGQYHRDLEYDDLGRLSLERNLDGAETRYEYDDRGLLRQVTDAEGRSVIYGWDDGGRLLSLRDPKGNETTFSYDAQGNRIAETRADGATWTYTWTSGGALETQTDPNGTLTTWKRNSLGDLTTVEIALGPGTGGPSTITYVLDPIGRVVQESTSEGVVKRYSWDSLDRVTRVEMSLSGSEPRAIDVAWDASGNPAILTYPSGLSLDLDWSSMNQLTTVADETSTIASFSSIGLRMDAKELGNGVVEDRSFLPELRHVSSISHSLGADLLERREYDRTPLGLKRKVTSAPTDRIRDYAFDRTGWIELETETVPDGTQDLISSYTLDGGFNYETIERIVQTPEQQQLDTRAFSVDDRNRYTSINDVTPLWDSNGNLIEWDGATLTYDAWNRLSWVAIPDGSTWRFIRDPDGNVVRKVITTSNGDEVIDRVVWQSDILEEWSGSTLLGRFIHGREIDEILRADLIRDGETTALYPLQDELHNVLALTDETGALLERYRYDGYGNIRVFDPADEELPAPTQPWSRFFQGRELLPELDAYDFRNRVLWTELGRFGQEDPLGFRDSPNLYQAMLGNPASLSDPFGLEVEPDGPPPYGIVTGQQAHFYWMVWLRAFKGPFLGVEDETAFYDKSVAFIGERLSARPSQFRRRRPDVASIQIPEHVMVWELKPRSYQTGHGVTRAETQMRRYEGALHPAALSGMSRGLPTLLNSPAGELMPSFVVDEKGDQWTLRVYSNPTPQFRGLLYYELTPTTKSLREKVREVADQTAAALCGPGLRLVFTMAGIKAGELVGAIATGGTGLTVGTAGGPAGNAIGLLGGTLAGRVIGGVVGGVLGSMYGDRLAEELCE